VHGSGGGAEGQGDVGDRFPKLRMPTVPFKLNQDCRHRHCQLVGLRLRQRAVRTACSQLRRSGDAGDLGPGLESLGPGGSMLGGGRLMAAKLEQVADPVMGRQEALRLAG